VTFSNFMSENRRAYYTYVLSYHFPQNGLREKFKRGKIRY